MEKYLDKKERAKELILKEHSFFNMQPSVKQKVSSMLPWLLQQANIRQLFQKTFPHLEANLSAEMRNMISKGELSFMYGKNGDMLAILKRNNKIYKQVPLKQSDIQPNQAQAFGMLAIQLQLQEIQNQLREIKEILESLRQGQMNDRFACIVSARRLLEEALLLPEKERELLLVNAQAQISLGMAQIELDFKQELSYLINCDAKSFLFFAVEKTNREVEQHAQYFCQNLLHLHQAAFLRAAIYFHMDKIPLMKKVLYDYQDGLNRCFPESVRLKLNSNIGNQPGVISAWNEKLKEVHKSFESLILQVDAFQNKEEIDNEC